MYSVSHGSEKFMKLFSWKLKVIMAQLTSATVVLPCTSATYPLPTCYPPRSATVEAGKGAEISGQAGNTARVSLFRNLSRFLSGPFQAVPIGSMVCRRWTPEKRAMP
jgi:hypothetical protein